MLKYVIIMNFIARIFAQYCLEHYLCDILVFFVRKRLRIKMGQMVTERGNHLFLYTFQLKIFGLLVKKVHKIVGVLTYWSKLVHKYQFFPTFITSI